MKQWLLEFKIALAEKDILKIGELTKKLPKSDSVIDMTEALYLTQEADKLAQSLRSEALESKNKLQKSIDFMQSTQTDTPSKFDTNN
ncbi:MAG: hypothetical protein U9R50_04400 [Campylobacterota bacterium]|nr:hypothetical protein [Campylobacterota bacterium]